MAEFKLSKTHVEITASGKKKIKAIDAAVEAAMERVLRAGAREYKQLLAAEMPDEEEEAELLSAGDADIAVRAGTGIHSIGTEADVGTPKGGRFLKIDMLSLQDAILQSSIEVTKTGKRSMQVVTARDSEINARSGFSWQTHGRGIQGPTRPFNRNLMGAMNDGGVWEVFPRGGRLLNPDQGVLATRMVKTLQPRHGRQTAQAVVRPKVHAALERAIARALKQVEK